MINCQQAAFIHGMDIEKWLMATHLHTTQESVDSMMRAVARTEEDGCDDCKREVVVFAEKYKEYVAAHSDPNFLIKHGARVC